LRRGDFSLLAEALAAAPQSMHCWPLVPVIDRCGGLLAPGAESVWRQNTTSLELRAVMRSGRLWLRRDRYDEAHQLLTEIYGWFTLGFDTGNIQETKALRDQLSCIALHSYPALRSGEMEHPSTSREALVKLKVMQVFCP
jgi:hypothetical protein